MFVIHANLDCEATWTGRVLPPAVARRVGLYGALISVFAPPGETEVWIPAASESARWLGRPVAFRVGAPDRADLAWAAAGAKAANDRRLAQRVCALPGAQVIERVDALEIAGPWVAKLPWTAAGRDRCRGTGAPTVEQRTRLERLLAIAGALVVEPWCERVVDFGVCARLAAGTVTQDPPHGLLVDARGGFSGIDLAEPALTAAERGELVAAVERAGAALAAIGYQGPFGVDGFAYHDRGERRLHAICEINARLTFGAVARAYGRNLGLAGTPPAGATILVAPADDGVTAWLA